MLKALLLGVSIIIIIPVLFLFIQVISALIGKKFHKQDKIEANLKISVLIPAHNEALVIAETIEAVKKQLNKQDNLLVVADNCSDQTAEIARKTGANVLVRHNVLKRGKGFALDYGIRSIEGLSERPDVLIILDADCIIEDGGIIALAQKSYKTQRPVQSLYLMQSKRAEKTSLKIAEFAWVVKNWVRPLGNLNLGFPCQLMGSGMAFPWRLITKVSFASSEIVEDMKLGVDFALSGSPPVFYPSVKVTSYFPDSGLAIKNQRTRWEHGHLGILLSMGPRLIIHSVRKFNFRLLGMGLDLMIPPLALMSILVIFINVLVAVSCLFEFSVLLVSFSLSSFILFLITIILAWFGWGRSLLKFKDLLGIPAYIFSKLTIYLLFWNKRQKDWIKTDRDN